MADTTLTLRVTGKLNDKTVTILSTNKMDKTLAVDDMFSYLNGMQPGTSVKIEEVSHVTKELANEETITNEPGDYLETSEVFQPDFSDTALVPSLQLKGHDAGEFGSKVMATIKYIADPEDTADFDTKVQTAAAKIGELRNMVFTLANMTFTAREDNIFTAD